MGIPRSVACLFVIALAASGCGGEPPVTPPSRPPLEGTLVLKGLLSPVTVVRDHWGIPHITASNPDDLFFAQGFIQAQDRLFQMDLWRRAAQGRLSEVLGANFILRDVMTRRMQYRGDMTAEWTSYGPDTLSIATAFVNGINAWVGQARAQLPEEFILAGWTPELWQPEDLLNRTEAFVASGNALDEMLRVQLAATLGIGQVDRLLPPSSGRPSTAPRGLNLSLVTPIVIDGLRRVGTEPFFMALAAAPDNLGGSGSNAWAVGPSGTDSGAALLAADPHRWLAHPSLRYLVHLRAPGWHVVGATAPWRPGVAIGHNERLAWGMTAADLDTQDIYVERVHPEDSSRVSIDGAWVETDIDTDVIEVKGREEAFEFDRQVTPHGVVVAVDPDRHLAYALRWSGYEPGTAAELSALLLNRAQSWSEFNDALGRWKMPPAEFIYADVDGHVARQVAGLLPTRDGWNGELPVPGWSGEYEWRGWSALDRLSRSIDPSIGRVVSANDTARASRINDVLAGTFPATTETFQALQLDTVSWNALQLVPLLEGLTAVPGGLEQVRRRLVAWDKRMDGGGAALFYASWEKALLDRLVRLRVPTHLSDQAAERVREVFVSALLNPSAVWFDGDPTTARDALLMAALRDAETGSSVARDVMFMHPLPLPDVFRARLNVGPFSLPGATDTVFSVTRSGDRVIGPTFRMIADLHDWDRSVVTNAPGQSGSPSSDHFRDLAEMWAADEYVSLPYSEELVRKSGRMTLTLVPPAAPTPAYPEP